ESTPKNQAYDSPATVYQFESGIKPATFHFKVFPVSAHRTKIADSTSIDEPNYTEATYASQLDKWRLCHRVIQLSATSVSISFCQNYAPLTSRSCLHIQPEHRKWRNRQTTF
ncbi:hypothetical protein BaRGS_00021223, partial [Batillaria attramentaria]